MQSTFPRQKSCNKLQTRQLPYSFAHAAQELPVPLIQKKTSAIPIRRLVNKFERAGVTLKYL
jgi:hypothetical protein